MEITLAERVFPTASTQPHFFEPRIRMATLTNPAEIARETLKQMMLRRMAPSPDNYRAIYNEIAGIVDKPSENFPERELRALLQILPKDTTAQQGLVRQVDQSLKNRDWNALKQSLAGFLREQGGKSDASWGELISGFLLQWETKQSGLTQARKRESLDRVLSSSGRNNELLFGRLQNLTRSWSQNDAAIDEIELADAAKESIVLPADPASALGTAAGVAGDQTLELRKLLVFSLENLVATLLEDQPEYATQARTFAVAARNASTLKSLAALLTNIHRFAYQLEFVVEDRAEMRDGLLKLLQLMIDNVGELVVEDRWLNGQLEMVRGLIAQPMNRRTINDAEQRLKEVIFKQSHLKHSLVEAQDALKQLLSGFVDHLADFADSTSDYHDKIERCAEKIKEANDIAQLGDVLDEVINETRIIRLNAQRSRDDLHTAKQRVATSEQRINELQNELDKASQLVRHDQLTGALNRRGLEEICESEMARARRRHSPLCLALLDVDNFKKLNDSLGHDAGDAALVHLVTVIRETLRPQDTLARFGGEEFIILLPDTAPDDAGKALARVQRELTKRYFLNNNEKLLITFSAGITEVTADDTQESAVKRADGAMYTAKTTGKNRVVTA